MFVFVCLNDKYNEASLVLDTLTKTLEYSQMIDKPTNFINGTSSCINLIVSSNVNFNHECKIEQSVFDKYHHKMTFGKLNLKVPLFWLLYAESEFYP